MFRLDTKAKRAANRASMIPANAVPDPRNGPDGEAYTYEVAGRWIVLAFWGSSGRPTFHYSYRTPEAAAEKIYEFFQSLRMSREYKDKRRVTAATPHNAKVGDIFSTCWGYDQTNVEYYEIVRLIGATMAEVQEIQSESEETGYLQGKSVPCPGVPAMMADHSDAGKAYHAEHGHYPLIPKPTFRVKITGGNSPGFLADGHYASKETPVSVIAGKPVYRANHWTAYA